MKNEIYLVKIRKSKKDQANYLNRLLNYKNPKYYSKSYSGDYAALMISFTKPVAIDIEKKKLLTHEQMAIFESFMFNTKDCISYSKIFQSNFYKIWVIKEVYSKYFGEGLYIDFKRISIEKRNFDSYRVSYKNGKHVIVKIIEKKDYVVAYI